MAMVIISQGMPSNSDAEWSGNEAFLASKSAATISEYIEGAKYLRLFDIWSLSAISHHLYQY